MLFFLLTGFKRRKLQVLLRKIDAKIEEKVKDWDSLLSAQDKLNTSQCLAASPSLLRRKPTKKPKGVFSKNPVLSA